MCLLGSIGWGARRRGSWFALAKPAVANWTGIVWGARASVAVSIKADYFRRSNYATIMVFSSMVMMVGPLFAGYMAARLGDYNLARP